MEHTTDQKALVMQVELSKYELDLLTLALERSATRFESQVKMSLKRASAHKAEEHGQTATAQRRLLHRLLSLRKIIHREEQQRWNDIARRA